MKLCVTTCVDGPYQSYVPLWLYCLRRSYPEYGATVFVADALRPDVKAALLPFAADKQVRIVEGEFDGYPTPHRYPAYYRFLLFTPARVQRYWKLYDAVYVTDGDLMIVREDPPLVEQHCRHMVALNMNYSNVLRPLNKWKTETMTGLHFATRDHMHFIGSMCEEYSQRFKKQGLAAIPGKWKIGDERLLYLIVADAMQDMPPHMTKDNRDSDDPANCDQPVFRPTHGLNAGTAIGGAAFDLTYDQGDWAHVRANAHRFAEMAGDPLFWQCWHVLDRRQRHALARLTEAHGCKLKEPQ